MRAPRPALLRSVLALVLPLLAGPGCEVPRSPIPGVRLPSARGTEAASPTPAASPGHAPATEADAAAREPVPEDALGRGTPRGAVLGFLRATRLGRWQEAAAYLDLGPLPPAEAADSGPLLARHLKAVLDRKLRTDVDEIPDAARGNLDDGLSVRRDRVASIDTPDGPVEVLLERRALPGEPLLWRFAPRTVAHIPDLYLLYGYGPLADILPDSFYELRFLDLALGQWLGLVLLVLLGALAAWLLTAVVRRALRPLAARTPPALDDRLLAQSRGPSWLLAFALLLAIGSPFLALPLGAQTGLRSSVRVLVVLAIAWFGMRFVDLATEVMKSGLLARGHTLALTLTPALRRGLKTAIVLVTGVFLLQSLGMNVSGIVAGLGIGGLALALAAQKTLENLFGGASLVLDQTVRVGDTCRYGDRTGTVEDIGVRATRIRTPERSVVSIPNAAFAALHLENFRLRDRFLFKHTLGLRPDTPADVLRYVIVELRALLAAHPKVLVAPVPQVRLVRLGASSIHVDVTAYIATGEQEEFVAVQEALLLQILDRIAACGTGLALPSQALYLGRDAGADVEKRAAAADKVRAWRAAGEAPGLPLTKDEAKRLLGDPGA